MACTVNSLRHLNADLCARTFAAAAVRLAGIKRERWL
jgi:hypothetical protein